MIYAEVKADDDVLVITNNLNQTKYNELTNKIDILKNELIDIQTANEVLKNELDNLQTFYAIDKDVLAFKSKLNYF
jgi:hypothetical protein